jgi:DNA repair protein SbcC/Rad50
MIPVKLSLRNFLCYRDQMPPLSFEGIHVACLCGDNGNGKSALFDAMTWALWGKSRTQSADDLIHIGQTEMEVEFEFDSGGQRYRVIRKRTKRSASPRPGQSILELHIKDGDTFKSISGNTIDETQEKIIGLIKLDYDTFVNSAFIRQGHANEFSVKKPAERKQVIANIMGLAIYDDFEKKAKDMASKLETDATIAVNTIEEFERQLVNRDEYAAESTRLSSVVDVLEKERLQQETHLAGLRKQKEILELKREQAENYRARKLEIETDLQQWQKKVENYSSAIEAYERVLVKKDEIRKGYADFADVKERNDEFNKKLSALMAIREQKAKLEKKIVEQNHKLTTEFEVIQARIRQKEEKSNSIPEFETKLNAAHSDMEEIALKEAAVVELRKKLESVQTEKNRIQTSLAQLDIDIKGIHEKVSMLEGDDARCPLCESELGSDGRHKIREKYSGEITEKLTKLKDNNARIVDIKAEQQKIEKEIFVSESRLNQERVAKLKNISTWETELAAARQAKKEIEDDRDKLSNIEQQLSSRSYAVAEQNAFNELDKEERTLEYDSARHEKVKSQLLELQKYEKMKQDLEATEQNIIRDKQMLAEAEAGAQKQAQSLKQAVDSLVLISTEISGMEPAAGELVELEKKYKELMDQDRGNRDKLSQIQERLRHLDEIEKLKAEKEKQLGRYQQEAGAFKELAEAFSKKGVQSLLIQQAFPEIEHEANRLLGKMTDNRLTLTLESQKEAKTKKSDPIETLDIKIGDELGTRNYEMFSGGESFRIDLALRIALSRLLVRRAGASLPILIIDEGFGTQDQSGREKLVQTINSIQDDFEKIFVITHLEDLKDYFPVQLRVSKTAGGSTIAIE